MSSKKSPQASSSNIVASSSQAAEHTQGSETTPLLSGTADTPRYDGEHDGSGDGDTPTALADSSSLHRQRSAASSIRSSSSMAIKGPRWASIIAMTMLAVAFVTVILVAFFVPAAVEDYAKAAAVLEPTNLSLESITTNGVRARIQANFRLDATRVKNDHVRRIGKASTWIAGELGIDQTRINVYLPEFDNVLLGTAAVPPMVIKLREGETTMIDVVADLTPGDTDGIRMIANEWLEGRLDRLRVKGDANIQLKTGFLPLGTHTVSESLTFEADKIPDMPQYNITRMNFVEAPIPGENRQGMAADVSVTAYNEYPVSVDIPPVGFEILLPGCRLDDAYIVIADALTKLISVRPQSNVTADVRGLVRELPESLTKVCPESRFSPLDMLLKQYMDGEAATVFVRGAKHPSTDTPEWLNDILSSFTLPVPFPGQSFDGLIRNFSLTDVHFSLPDPFAEPGDPDSNPKVSGNIVVLAGLPSEMNFDINVTNVRATADVFYHNKKLGELNLQRWQKAKSARVKETKNNDALLKIESRIKDAPLNVTDADVMTDLIEAMLFGGKAVLLDVQAAVDVQVETVLGQLVLKDVPAEGENSTKTSVITPVVSMDSLNPKIGNISIVDTTPSSIRLQVIVNITNPTPYTAYIPSINLHLISNGSLIGEAEATNMSITTGNNTNLVVSALWKPFMGGDRGVERGRDLLSSYISGFNTSATIRTYNGSIPGLPHVGNALSRLNFTMALPRLSLPGGDDNDKGHFLRDATFHILTSSATFAVISPFSKNTLYIERINATAFYNHTEPVGRIDYEYPIACPPGESTTPKLPVEWSFGSGGYEKMRKALGGTLKLDAKATVGVRLGSWTETVWYIGRGIGANVRL